MYVCSSRIRVYVKNITYRSMYRSGQWVQRGRSYVLTATYMQCMNGDGAHGLCHCTGSGAFIASPGVDTILLGIYFN